MPIEKEEFKALNLVKTGATDSTRESKAAAEILLSHVLGVKRKDIYLANTITKNQKEAFLRLADEKARSSKPIAYLLGTQEFMGLNFKVAERATLIPRPETEALVEFVLSKILKSSNDPLTLPSPSRGEGLGEGEPIVNILDIGTGSGCVGLSLWHYLHESFSVHITLTDVSKSALEIARENAHALKVPTHSIHITQDTWPKTNKKFHLIVSNPPYVKTADYRRLPKEIRDWEPKEALLGGQDGLDVIREIVVGSKNRLAPRAMLALEMDPRQAIKIRQIMLKNSYKEIGVVKDLEGRDRIIHGRL